MPALSLPPTFTNSFWSQEYRGGLETLYAKLEQGIEENEEVVAFIRARVSAENQIAASLTIPELTGPRGAGFGADDGASLLMAFRGLQAESIVQGEAHKTIAKELETKVADPFESWAQGHRERVRSSRSSIIDVSLKSYELAQGDVEKLKHQYLSKMRRADEAEDDAKFAPSNDLGDTYTTSPRLAAFDTRAPKRAATISERITQRLKEIQRKTTYTEEPAKEPSILFESQSPNVNPADEGKASPKADKGKGKAVEEPKLLTGSPPPLSPPLPPKLTVKAPTSPMPPAPPSPILLAGLALPPSAVSDLLKRAVVELPLRSVKFPILGEYQDCFTGEEFATWLTENVQGFGGSLDRAEDAARDLTEREGALRRIGELGNKFENSDEAFYQFRPKAFDLHPEIAKGQENIVSSPVMANLSPMADNFVKRSNTFVNLVQKALVASTTSEPIHVKARADAEASDKTYRVAVRKLDRQRLGLEERIEETLKTLQRWESDRLKAVKTVLLQYQGTLTKLPTALQPTFDRSSTLIASYQPESDLKALIERYRTGPFRPAPQVYDSITHDESDVVFGIDLRRWADGGWNDIRGEEKKDQIPEVVTALLAALNDAYVKLPGDNEKRKTWIYEVPLHAVHHLRESINAIPPGKRISPEMLAKYDGPVLASTIKLWALELDPPLGLWEGWEDIRRIYPIVGAPSKTEEEASSQQHIQDLRVVLQRLPLVHLHVLDAIISHLKTLIDTTKVEESNDVYMTKLALSMGRTLLRPKFETEISIQDRHPTLLLIDLLSHYEEIIPPTIVKKKRESDRKVPLRKRTAPIDMRMSRSRLSVGADTQEILQAQLLARNPNVRPALHSTPSASSDQGVPPPIISTSSPAPPPAPAVAAEPSIPAVPEEAPNVAEPEKIPSPVTEVPPPAAEESDTPPVPPSFKEPPLKAEELDTPPMPPSFKEPPPETDDEPLPMPKFVDPPPEVDEMLDTVPNDPVILPPSPQQTPPPVAQARQSPSPSGRSATPTTPTSPEDATGASLSRSSSGEASRLRGPRGARGPRPQSVAATSVASMVAGLNRPASNGSGISSRLNRGNIGGRPLSAVNPHDYEPRKKGVGRAQASAFSRRTMASDAEDEVVEK